MKAAIIVLAVILTLPGVPVWAQDDPPCTNGDCPPDDPPCTNGDCPPDDPPCTNGDCPPDDPPCTNGDCPPGGDTPANEGVCDDLKWATPGLYGLCIAFCEAQDCELDFSLENPFENCRPSSEKLLRNYNRKKKDWDPEMPCIQEPCPCWTLEELEALGQFPDWREELSVCIGAQFFDYWRVISSDWCIRHRVHTLATGFPLEYQCHFRDWHPCPGDEDPTIDRTFDINFEEFEVCRAQLIEAGIDLGFECWD